MSRVAMMAISCLLVCSSTFAQVAPPVITANPESASVSTGASVSFSAAAIGEGLTYQWLFDGAYIPGATSPVYTINSASLSNIGSYHMLTWNSAGDSTATTSATLTVDGLSGPPEINCNPSNTVSAGNSVTLSVPDYGTAITYQWRHNGASVLGATSSSYTIANATIAHAGSYDVVLSNAGVSVTSYGKRLYVMPSPDAPVITVQPQPEWQIVNAGGSLTYSVTATGGLPLSYQWRLDGVDIPGATSATLTLTGVTLANQGEYTVVVSNTYGSVTSNPAIADIVGPEIDTITPVVVTSGSGDFTLAIAGSRFASNAVVFWNGAARPTSFIDDCNLTAAIPASDVVGTGGIFTALITVQYPNGVVSDPSVLTVVPPSVEVAQSQISPDDNSVLVSSDTYTSGAAGVTVWLENNTVGTGAAIVTAANYSSNPTPIPSFDVGGKFVDVQVTGADATDVATAYFFYPDTITGSTEGDLVLQFYNGTAWQPVLSSGGATPLKETTDNLGDVEGSSVSGGRFTVVFDNTSTPKITELTGTVFTTSLINNDIVPPVIQSVTASPALLLPANHRMVAVTVSVTATDDMDAHPSSRIVSVTSNEPINGRGDGNTTPDWEITGALTLNLRAERANGGDGRVYTITVETKDAAGNATTATTTVVVPKDNDADRHPPKITTQPHSQTATIGADVTLSVAVAPALPVTYQWKFNGANIPNATSATLTLHTVTMANAGNYKVTITNSIGSTTSRVAQLTVVPLPPVIITGPQSQTVDKGDSVTFTVMATSEAPLSYQWYFNGKKIGRAKSATLTLTHVNSDDAGAYSVVVSNDGGEVTSSAATLTVLLHVPIITTAPQSQSVNSGASVTFTVAATSPTSLSYQWLFNGRRINGARSATLTLRKANLDDAGSYSVVVSNDDGDVTSPSATLTVVTPRITALNPSTVRAGSGGFTLTVTGAGFVNGDDVEWNGDERPTTFVNSTTLTAAIRASDVPRREHKNVDITVKSPSGDRSNSKTLTIAP
ncbi:MAG: immunoglobulin domain-containing protein [Opitutaceae bacterium]